jgi:hypothetical protein
VVVAGSFLVADARAADGLRYHFSTTTEGAYRRAREGDVTVDGSHWRIDFEVKPGEVTELNAIIGGEGSALIAVNDSLQTWFRLKSRSRLATENSLFTYGDGAKVSKVKMAVRTNSAGASGSSSGQEYRVTFSYSIVTKVSSEDVKGDVWGEIRVQVGKTATVSDLPWRPLDLQTGISEVDERLRKAIDGISGTPVKAEIEVSRELEGGVTLQQRITRQIGDIVEANATRSLFAVPATYRYQEPLIGGAGISSSPTN